MITFFAEKYNSSVHILIELSRAQWDNQGWNVRAVRYEQAPTSVVIT